MIKNFNGKPIKINKKGFIYPVDAELKEENGKNLFNISAKVKFLDLTVDEYADMEMWKKSVLDGFRDWAGEYLVFGNQQLTVKVDIEETDRIIDSVFVLCFDKQMSENFQNEYDRLNMVEAEAIFKQNRSFALSGIVGLGWKAYLPRIVYMLPHTLHSLEAARITAKHEFGHVLGIGDLYRDPKNGLQGIPGDKYYDISPHYYGSFYYDMVMCNNGPVRNNDIEMVLLAFSTDSFQNYQKQNNKGKISEALGKGN